MLALTERALIREHVSKLSGFSHCVSVVGWLFLLVKSSLELIDFILDMNAS